MKRELLEIVFETFFRAFCVTTFEGNVVRCVLFSHLQVRD